MRVNLIFAITPDKLFGIDNRLPWISCKEDMKFFSRTTSNTFNPPYVVMGRKTFESLPAKLEDRINVVISSQETDLGADLQFKSLDAFFLAEKEQKEIFIIGGKGLIEEALSKYKTSIQNIYVSIINKEVVDGTSKVYLDVDLANYSDYLQSLVSKGEVTFHKYTFPIHPELQYLSLLHKTLSGDNRQTRNAKTFSIFSEKLSFDLSKGFPLLTTKKMFLRGIFEELLFFFRGQTDSKILESKGVNIWKPNTTTEFIQKCNLPYSEGDMGPLYGFNWKHFGAEYINCHTDYSGKGHNQLEDIMELLIKDPHSRRILLTDYNPAVAKQGVLYPCHSIIIQFYVTESSGKNKVSMNMYQRSVDEFLGLPFNIASNALFLHLLCATLNVRTGGDSYEPGILNILMGDCHVYESHLEAVKEQLARTPHDLPRIVIHKPNVSLEDYDWKDIEIINYNHHPAIKAEMIA
jgi:thymidylate synthase